MVHHIGPDPVAVRGSSMSVSSPPRIRISASIVPMPGTAVHEYRRPEAQEDEKATYGGRVQGDLIASQSSNRLGFRTTGGCQHGEHHHP